MKPKTLALLATAVLAAGCAKTLITSQDPNSEIYLGDEMIGVGEARVDRVGPPRTVKVEARRSGRTVGSQEMSRSFTFMTVVWGFCSYYTGFYWGWYYPESVLIPVQVAPAGKSGAETKDSPWSNPRESVWMKPIR